MAKAKKRLDVYVVSDATAITAERVISAVLVQFSRHIHPRLKRYPLVRTTKALRRILDLARRQGGIVAYSLVSREMREWIESQDEVAKIELVDIMGPLLDRMEMMLGVSPRLLPGLLGSIGDKSLRLAEAIDFTLSHDDGQGLSDLGRADLIIMGASRTSKTPTSLFLSCNHSLKVANVPLIPGVEPPAKLFNLKRPRMVGFTIDAQKLAHIRTRRYRGRSIEGYNDLSSIRKELAHCRRIFKRIAGITVMDVSDSSIEEIANHLV